MKGSIKAVCVSEKKGTAKTSVASAEIIMGFGIKSDAHGGSGKRQISLLPYEKVEAFNQQGANVISGAFGENLVTEGINFNSLPIGTRLSCGEALLEITQKGKECHDRCQIYEKMGDCIMPREGVFAIVLQSGAVSAGDIIEVLHE